MGVNFRERKEKRNTNRKSIIKKIKKIFISKLRGKENLTEKEREAVKKYVSKILREGLRAKFG